MIGIYLENCSDVTLEDNTFVGVDRPVVARGVTNLSAARNRSYATPQEAAAACRVSFARDTGHASDWLSQLTSHPEAIRRIINAY